MKRIMMAVTLDWSELIFEERGKKLLLLYTGKSFFFAVLWFSLIRGITQKAFHIAIFRFCTSSFRNSVLRNDRTRLLAETR